jgi:hypothetical protein
MATMMDERVGESPVVFCLYGDLKERRLLTASSSHFDGVRQRVAFVLMMVQSQPY